MARRDHYLDNREKLIRLKNKRSSVIKTWFKGFKKTLKCGRCPENHPAVLQFHHVGEKDFSLGKAVN